MAEPLNITSIQSRFMEDETYNLDQAYAELMELVGEGILPMQTFYTVFDALVTQDRNKQWNHAGNKSEANINPYVKGWTILTAEQRDEAYVGAGGPAYDPLDARTRARRGQETDPAGVYRRYLSTQADAGFSPEARDFRREQMEPALASFRLSQTNPDATFRDWLQQDGQLLTPAEQAARIVSMGSLQSGLREAEATRKLTDEEQLQATMVDAFTNPVAFRTAAEGRVGRMNPFWRASGGRVAQQQYDRFMADTPEESFLQYLGKQGGKLFSW